MLTFKKKFSVRARNKLGGNAPYAPQLGTRLALPQKETKQKSGKLRRSEQWALLAYLLGFILPSGISEQFFTDYQFNKLESHLRFS